MPMDRRTFVTGGFGLALLATGLGVTALNKQNVAPSSAVGRTLFTTPASGEPEDAVGPLMMAGISLVELPDSENLAAFFGDTELFDVNAAGAELVRLADGTRSLNIITAEAATAGHSCDLADVALFFSSLDQAGYLRNHLQVSLMEPVA